MAKTSSMKGYQKKTSRAGARVQRDILKGKHAPTLSLKELQRDFQRATKGAEELYAPIKANALQEFGQSTLPGVLSEFGDAGLGRSSALNQALAAARTNLSRQLASDFAGFQTNLAQNMIGQREQNKTNYLSQLANLSTQRAFQNPYMSKNQQGSAGMGAPLIAGGMGALGSYAGTEAGAATLGGLFGGGGAAATGAGTAATVAPLVAASSREVKDNIRNYDKGLEVVRELDVKQYDYTIPVEGRQDNRVGLIAENVPSEIQAMIGSIKGVDVYGLVSLLVNAVKQLDHKVKVLEARG